MTVYRLAVLSGNTTRFTACTVHHFTTVTAASYPQARLLAARLNAVICGRTVAA